MATPSDDHGAPPEAIFDWAFLTGHAEYWMFITLMMAGLFMVVARGNLVKKVVGLNIFQVSVFMLYISIGKITDGTAPIFPLNMDVDPDVIYSNPLPHVLMLTAIVVGIATTSLALALIVRIREAFGTIEEDELLILERAIDTEENRRYSAQSAGDA
ncbi:MAG: cation:proton antiporter subunit C [Pseudomonadota bacterium]